MIDRTLKVEEAKSLFEKESFCVGEVNLVRAAWCVRLLGRNAAFFAVESEREKDVIIYRVAGCKRVFFTLHAFLEAVTYRNIEITQGIGKGEFRKSQNTKIASVIDFTERARRKKAAIGAGTPIAAVDTTQGCECVKREYNTTTQGTKGTGV